MFFSTFFLTPVLLAIAGVVMWRARHRLAGNVFSGLSVLLAAIGLAALGHDNAASSATPDPVHVSRRNGTSR